MYIYSAFDRFGKWVTHKYRNTAYSIAHLRAQSWSRSFHLANIYLNTNQIMTMIYSAGWMYLRLVRVSAHQRLMGSHRTRQKCHHLTNSPRSILNKSVNRMRTTQLCPISRMWMDYIFICRSIQEELKMAAVVYRKLWTTQIYRYYHCASQRPPTTHPTTLHGIMQNQRLPVQF